MAVVYVTTVGAATGTAAATTIGVGSVNAIPGHFGIALLTIAGGTATPIPPAGWVQVDTGSSAGSTATRCYLYTKVFTAAVASETWSVSAAASFAVTVSIYAGVSQTDVPNTKTVGGSTAATSWVAPGITTVSTNTVVISFAGLTTSATGVETTSVANGTGHGENVTGLTTAGNAYAGMADQRIAAAGAVPANTSTGNVAAWSVMFTIALRPSPPLGQLARRPPVSALTAAAW